MLKKINVDLVIAGSAVFISVCAFVVSFYQASVMQEQTEIFQKQQELMNEQTSLIQEQQRMSVWPRLLISRSTSYNGNTGGVMDNNKYDIWIKNAGLGPAEIKYAEVSFDGKIVKRWVDIHNLTSEYRPFARNNSNMPGSILLSGEIMYPLQTKGESALGFLENSNKVFIKLCYCSVYNQCWILDENKGRISAPEKVQECSSDKNKLFTGS